MQKVRHGHTSRLNGKVTKSPTYQSWSSMNDRCYITTHKWYRLYGGEGVKVCDRWRRGMPNAFINFLADMGERPAKDMTLDRWPNTESKNYEPGNCQWADKVTQAAHRRSTPRPTLPQPPPTKGDDNDFTIEGSLSKFEERVAG